MPAQPKQKSELLQKISQFLEHLEVERGCSPLTIRNYQHYLIRFCSWMEKEKLGRKLADINQEVVRRYRIYLTRLPGHPAQTKVRENLNSRLSRKTQAYHVIALRSFLRWLVKNDYKVLAPEKIDLPKVQSREVKFLNGELIDRLLNAPSLAKITGKRDKAILELFFSTGLRVSELVKLNQNQLDWQSREFGIIGKGGKSRVAFLSKRASQWLKKYLSARKDNYKPLFIRHRGKKDPSVSDEEMRLSARSVQRMVKKYVRKVKLPIEATPHTIRHSFATDLLMAGADLRSVQEMLGHKNISTTQIYTHVTNRQLRQVHAAFHGKGGVN